MDFLKLWQKSIWNPMTVSNSENDLSISSRFPWHVAHTFFWLYTTWSSFSAMKLYQHIACTIHLIFRIANLHSIYIEPMHLHTESSTPISKLHRSWESTWWPYAKVSPPGYPKWQAPKHLCLARMKGWMKGSCHDQFLKVRTRSPGTHVG